MQKNNQLPSKEHLKKIVKRLKKEQGWKTSVLYEYVAKSYGFKSWNQMAAAMKENE